MKIGTNHKLVRLKSFLNRLSESSPGDFSSLEEFLKADELTGWKELLNQLRPLHQVERLDRENQLLKDVSNRLALGLDTEQLSEHIMDTLGDLVSYDAAGLYLIRGGQIAWETLRGYATESLQLVRKKLDRGIMSWAGRHKQSVLLGDVVADERYLAIRSHTQSELVVPIMLEQELIGFFNLESDLPHNFTEEDRYLVEVFAAQVALAVERARLVQDKVEARKVAQELELARRIQRDHFPSDNLEQRDLLIAGTNLTCHEVGGDYYDYFNLDEHRILLVVADVTGKGVPAGLLMTSVRAGIHLLSDSQKELSGLVTRLNEYLVEITEADVFVTLFCGIYDMRDASFCYVNGGHNPPIVLQKNGNSRILPEGGVLLGSFSGVPFELGKIQVDPGESILFYTDGISEALNEKEEEYSFERLRESFLRHGKKDPARALMCLLNDLQAFVGDGLLAQQTGDDLTLMVLKRREAETGESQ